MGNMLFQYLAVPLVPPHGTLVGKHWYIKTNFKTSKHIKKYFYLHLVKIGSDFNKCNFLKHIKVQTAKQ